MTARRRSSHSQKCRICSSRATAKCSYCGKVFCAAHKNPLGSSKKSHPCPEFVDVQGEKKKLETERYSEKLDRMRATRPKETPIVMPKQSRDKSKLMFGIALVLGGVVLLAIGATLLR